MICAAGYRGSVNETQCLARGCCWNSDIKEVSIYNFTEVVAVIHAG